MPCTRRTASRDYKWKINSPSPVTAVVMRRNMIHRLHLKIFADYYQFYVWDPIASGQTAPDDWNEQDVKNRAKVTEHVFVVSPIRNLEVPFSLEIYQADPKFHLNEWDHVVEASVNISSGRIEVHECTGGSHAELSIEPGIYGVRALYKGLSTITEDGLDGKDSYKLTMWKDGIQDFRIVKSFDKNA